jgi:cytochrome c oxidase cbb3-type subunit III
MADETHYDTHGESKPSADSPKTMGHEWDGIAEFNNPLPRWWVIVFMVCIAWALVFAVVMPSFPAAHRFFGGMLGYSSRADLRANIAETANARSQWLEPMKSLSAPAIVANPELLQVAMRGGEVIFKENCAACHGVGGTGSKGYPALVDDEWLWGGTLPEIVQTITHGVRTEDPAAHASLMPAFGRDGLLDRAQMNTLADYVMAISDGKPGAAQGHDLFEANCAVCHGPKGEGTKENGAPALNNQIWLYGGDRANIITQINTPRHGVMPTWQGRLTDVDIKQVAIYVHSLGGGK